MLSKTQNKHIRSLSQHKYRDEYKLFIAEGDKIAYEWLQSNYSIKMIVALDSWIIMNKTEIKKHPEAEVISVTEDELAKISLLQKPNKVLLVVYKPATNTTPPTKDWTIVLDRLQDPGNMGSIIRIADWFGIRHIVSAHNTVDAYHPKVVQAAMGSHLRINFYEASLEQYLSSLQMPILVANLNGDNVYDYESPEAAALVIGNEGGGVSEQVIKLATNCITIPRIGGAESLNASVSTGILCALLKRR